METYLVHGHSKDLDNRFIFATSATDAEAAFRKAADSREWKPHTVEWRHQIKNGKSLGQGYVAIQFPGSSEFMDVFFDVFPAEYIVNLDKRTNQCLTI